MTALHEERRPELSAERIDAARILVKLLSDRSGRPLKLSLSEMDKLNQVINKKRVEARTTLEKAGQPVEEVWIVLNGTLRTTSASRVLDVIDSPAIVGDDLALRNSESTYSVRAETAVNAFTIDAQKFRELIYEMPSLAAAWLGELTLKLEYDRIRMSYLLSGDLTSQLAGLLLHRQKGSQVFLTQATLASLLNVHRASVSRALHFLERHNAIEIGYGSVAIKDEAKLRKIAKSG